MAYPFQGVPLGELKYTAATGLPFARPIHPERAFHELLAPLELEPPVSTSDPKATGISWLWASWLRYIASQPPVCCMIDWSFPVTFIVNKDGNGDGDGDGGDQGDGPGAGECALGVSANRDEGMGVVVAGVEGEGVVGGGVVVGEGEGEVSSGAPRAPPNHTRGVAEGRTKRLSPYALAGTLTYHVCFTYPLSTQCFLCRLPVPVVFQ